MTEYSRVTDEHPELPHDGEVFHVVWIHFGWNKVSVVDSYKKFKEAMERIDELVLAWLDHAETYCLYEGEL